MSEKNKNDTTALPIEGDEELPQLQDITPLELLGAIVKLINNEPIFAAISRYLTKIQTTEIPTAGVCTRDNEWILYWNKKFVDSLSADHLYGLLKHELYHILLLHTTSRRWDPHWISNYATDLAINSMIPEKELPTCGLLPGKEFQKLTPSQIEKIGPEAYQRHMALSALIASFQKNLSSEEYFGLLMSNETIQQMEADRKANEEAFKKLMKALAEAGSEAGDGMDSHDGWSDKLGMDERLKVESQIRRIVSEAVKRADATNGWGSVSIDIQSKIRLGLEGEVPWQDYVKQFVGSTVKHSSIDTWHKVNRRDPLGQPGSIHSYTARIGVFVDQSGSVDDSMLVRLMTELAPLSKYASFTMYHFDTEVDVASKTVYDRRRGVTEAKRTRCGGTDFESVHKFVTSEKGPDHRFDAVIILTDGQAPEPSHAVNYRRMWLLPKGCKLHWGNPGNDLLVEMKKEIFETRNSS